MTGLAVVVDASVARAAGGAGAAHSAACACRDALEALRLAGLRVAFSPPLHDEWRRHKSAFARKWLASMYARRRVSKMTPAPFEPLRAACASLEERKLQRAIEKDAHLVDAAFAADRRVLSSDAEVQRALQMLAEQVVDLQHMLWGDPATDGCVACVRAGTPDVPRYRLRPARPRAGGRARSARR